MCYRPDVTDLQRVNLTVALFSENWPEGRALACGTLSPLLASLRVARWSPDSHTHTEPRTIRFVYPPLLPDLLAKPLKHNSCSWVQIFFFIGRLVERKNLGLRRCKLPVALYFQMNIILENLRNFFLSVRKKFCDNLKKCVDLFSKKV